MTKPDMQSRATELDRRKFLILSGVGGAGLLALPFKEAEAQARFYLVDVVVNLANALGCTVLARNIIGYVRQVTIPVATENEVYAANTEMAQDQVGRFTDLSRSTVYSPEGSYFFYPVVSQDGFNTCVAFFDRRRVGREQRIALIEGPTLYGIGRAAEDLARGQSTYAARSTFLPRRLTRRGLGAWNVSYSSPDIYQTDAGVVGATYFTEGNGKGRVVVEARNERGTLIGGGDYSLTYRV